MVRVSLRRAFKQEGLFHPFLLFPQAVQCGFHLHYPGHKGFGAGPTPHPSPAPPKHPVVLWWTDLLGLIRCFCGTVFAESQTWIQGGGGLCVLVEAFLKISLLKGERVHGTSWLQIKCQLSSSWNRMSSCSHAEDTSKLSCALLPFLNKEQHIVTHFELPGAQHEPLQVLMNTVTDLCCLNKRPLKWFTCFQEYLKVEVMQHWQRPVSW